MSLMDFYDHVCNDESTLTSEDLDKVIYLEFGVEIASSLIKDNNSSFAVFHHSDNATNNNDNIVIGEIIEAEQVDMSFDEETSPKQPEQAQVQPQLPPQTIQASDNASANNAGMTEEQQAEAHRRKRLYNEQVPPE
jgi:hypothetical protein